MSPWALLLSRFALLPLAICIGVGWGRLEHGEPYGALMTFGGLAMTLPLLIYVLRRMR